MESYCEKKISLARRRIELRMEFLDSTDFEFEAPSETAILESNFPPAGKASDYFEHFETACKPGDEFLLLSRVSKKSYEHHMPDQVVTLWNACQRKGAKVVNIVSRVVRAYQNESKWYNFIVEIVKLAKKMRLIILVTEVDRAIRNQEFRSYDSERCTLQATKPELEQLKVLLDGVRIMSKTHPDANSSESRSQEIKRSPQNRDDETKSQRHVRLKPTAIAMWKVGLSLGKIATALILKKSTINDWVKNLVKKSEH